MQIVTKSYAVLETAIKWVEKRFPGRGIIIIAFDPGDDKSVGYIGNAKREHAIQAMRAMLKRWDALENREKSIEANTGPVQPH